MQQILQEPIEQYLTAKELEFAGNEMANKFRHEFPTLLSQIIQDKERYKVQGSPGQGVWTDNPWIAILDKLITDTPQSGYYPVLLFKKDMSGVYLSLNQGVTEVRENYKRDTHNVLRLRAQDYRAKLNYGPNELLEINLNSQTTNARLYESGNIIAKYYSKDNLPNEEVLTNDILQYLNYYEELTFNDTHLNEEKKLTSVEKKQYRLHFRIERNGSISKKVKKEKGFICEACGFDFRMKYGDLGEKFIEAHHLTPVSSLAIGKYQVDIKKDFAILCSNCHSMIHRLEDCSDLQKLKRIIKTVSSNTINNRQ